MGNQKLARTLGLVTLGLSTVLGAGACSKSSAPALPDDVRSIVFLQRMPRTDAGNVFEYTSYVPGGRLVKLEPPSADGKLTVLTSDPMFKDADVMSYDISFDAQSIVFSAKLNAGDNYNLFSMNLDGTDLKQLTEGANDYVYPMYLPGGRIFFTTNLNVENEMASGTFSADAKQFKDEYERATTAQVGTMNLDGTNLELGPRNVSHRVAPALLPDGHVLYTEWRHMGGVNDGHLRMMNGDMTVMKEAFGGEEGGNGGTNSYLKGRYVQTITGRTDAQGNVLPDDVQLVTVATSRDRTLQAGKLFLVDLNGQREGLALHGHDAGHPGRPHRRATRAATTTPRSSATRATASSSPRGPTAPSSPSSSIAATRRPTSASISSTARPARATRSTTTQATGTSSRAP